MGTGWQFGYPIVWRGSGADDPGGNVILIGSVKDFERNAVHGLKLNGIVALDETSQGSSTGPLASRLAMGPSARGGSEVEYFDEAGYIRGGDCAAVRIPISGIASTRKPVMLCPVIAKYPTQGIPCK